MNNKLIIILAAFTFLGGLIGGVFAYEFRLDDRIERLEIRVDEKIKDSVAPIATDVREIRNLLNQLLLKMGGP